MFPTSVLTKVLYTFFSVSREFQIPHPHRPHTPRSYHLTTRGVPPLSKAYFPTSCHLIPLKSKYYPHYTVLKHHHLWRWQICGIMRRDQGDHPGDGSSKHVWNVGLVLPDYMTQYPRRLSSSYSPPWEPETSRPIFFAWNQCINSTEIKTAKLSSSSSSSIVTSYKL
jgi:hypothetical protein